MRAPVFLDSGAIYSYATRSDGNHTAVRAAYDNLSARFVLHELILVEAFSLITKRLSKYRAMQAISIFRQSPRIERAELTSDLLEAGWRRCLRYADKNWDWIDCISFELMHRRGLREALSLDRHFAQAGFILLVQ